MRFAGVSPLCGIQDPFRLLLRPSGTEPVIRILAEAESCH
ncbi:MAG: hypothetical protein IJ960_09270 [Oscillospiraceae bacterium]|nr:hypothetical protein [Oscillospiraceae bacterium]